MKTTTFILAVLTFTCGAFAEEKKENPKASLQNLMERIHDAKAAGRLDEARELSGQAERMQAELRKHEGTKKPEKHLDRKGPDAERMEHVMQAIQHLHAAGLHEPAEGIEQMAQHMRREMEERMRREHAEGRPSEGKPHAELEEIRQQMRRMAEQIERLQAELKKRAP